MLKKVLAILCLCGLSTFAKAQLTIYQGLQKSGTSQVCTASGLYIGSNIPGGLNHNFNSIVLTKGYMATLAEHEDGTGYSFCYVAATSNVDVDLSAVLQNRVSFIRVLPIGDIKKKGVCGKDNDVVAALKPSWFYDWGTSDVSTTDRQYVGLTFGLNAAADLTRVAGYAAKTDINCLSGFNEPNNTSQGNIPNPATAVPAYKNLLRTGYRMGSPATTEEQYNNWLNTFINGANTDTIRVDYIAIHWYDWGSSPQSNANPDVNGVLTRFKNYINNVYNLYHKPIWITEFNANTNRSTPTQVAFMQLALPYLEGDSRIERYAWFFENNSPATVNGNLTALGQIYSDHISTASYTANIIDTRTTNIASSDRNLVFNGDFENTTSYLTSWTPSNAGDFQKETTNAINTTSVRFASNTGDRNLISNAITVTPGKTYKVQFTARIQDAVGASGSPGPTRGGVFTGEILTAAEAATTFTTLSTSSSTNTILFGNYTVPTGQSSIKLRFRKTSDIAYLDDVSLVDVTDITTLPITLTSFTANAGLNGVDLNWKTSSESNNNYFTLYQSADGKVFNKKTSINSLGNSNSEKTYHFLDMEPSNGINYYQLSQTDFDGKTETFKPVSVNFKFENNHQLKVYANQESINFSLNWDLKELVTVNIFDTSGKRVFSTKTQLNNSNNLINLNIPNVLKLNELYVLNISGLKYGLNSKFFLSL